MALFPGLLSNVTPAVYGPIKYPVKKTAKGYYIKGYSKDEFTGSIQEIAKKILWKLVVEPEGAPRLHYVGPFAINFWPEMQCGLCMDPDPEPADLDTRAISDELTKELRPYITVTVEKNIITPHITFPNGSGPFPIASDSEPLLVSVKKGGIEVVRTDYNGLEFEVIGDKHAAAIAFLENSIKDCNQYGYMFDNKDRTDFIYRRGAFDFKVVNRRIVDVEPHFKEFIPYVPHTPEDRPEVLETVKIIKSALKMKAFL